MNKIEKALGVVLARVYFIVTIFSFIIIDTSFAFSLSVLKLRRSHPMDIRSRPPLNRLFM
jgi:hypothetical protein